MSHTATTNPDFLKKVEQWLSEAGEVLTLVRFRCGAGSREYHLFSAIQPFVAMMNTAPAGACITVFRNASVALRGIVDTSFIRKCLHEIPEGAEYLTFETEATVAGKHSWFHYGSGESHAELEEDLQQSLGRHVVAGFHPDMRAGPADAIDAVVPDDDGQIRRGPY
jgi:hypothetical protein